MSQKEAMVQTYANMLIIEREEMERVENEQLETGMSRGAKSRFTSSTSIVYYYFFSNRVDRTSTEIERKAQIRNGTIG